MIKGADCHCLPQTSSLSGSSQPPTKSLKDILLIGPLVQMISVSESSTI